VATTLLPILAAQFLDPEVRPTDDVTLASLVAIYSIYLFIPLYVALTNIFNEFPFGRSSSSSKKAQ
jgi:hypothetical protein